MTRAFQGEYPLLSPQRPPAPSCHCGSAGSGRWDRGRGPGTGRAVTSGLTLAGRVALGWQRHLLRAFLFPYLRNETNERCLPQPVPERSGAERKQKCSPKPEPDVSGRPGEQGEVTHTCRSWCAHILASFPSCMLAPSCLPCLGVASPLP